jgi:glucokinase
VRDPARVERRVQARTPSTNGPDVEAAMADAVRAVADGEPIAAVGVAAPGPLDHVRGIVHEAPNIPGFVEIHVADDMQQRLGVPVFLDRDVFVAAYAESKFGAGKAAMDWVYITISTGIGGAIVTGGRLLRGVSGTAGEIGHVPVDPNGPRCGCGNIGCIEALAGGGNIAKYYGAASAAEVFAAARRGDAKARAILDRAHRALADMGVLIVNLLNPGRIVVGGGIATGEPEFVFGAIGEAIRERAFAVPAAAVAVVPAALGDEVGLVGSALMARERAAGRQPLG